MIYEDTEKCMSVERKPHLARECHMSVFLFKSARPQCVTSLFSGKQ